MPNPGLCICPEPTRPTGREVEQLAPWECLTCGGYACEYADRGQQKCSPSICDCFIAQSPDSPRDLHPEAFLVDGHRYGMEGHMADCPGCVIASAEGSE